MMLESILRHLTAPMSRFYLVRVQLFHIGAKWHRERFTALCDNVDFS